MLGDLWGTISGAIGDGLSSVLESILNATLFKLFYFLEKALCWIIGILMELFEVFAGLEPVTYNGQQQYLINVFFSNKAISNIYWGMAIIGMVLIFVFALWAVIKKMFDIDGRQQQTMGQIIWSAVRSLFLIIGLTLVVSVVLNATGVLMRQIDYIFNNAYHLDQPQEREFTDEEYAAMGRVLATIGNYSMVPNSTNRYNLNLCFNDIRGDMYFLQEQGVFQYSYSTDRERDANGLVKISWQEILSLIARSTDLSQDVSVDVYHEGLARSITTAMEYLQSTSNPVPVESVKNTWTVSERTHLDRMIFLLGTFRAAKNDAFNENPTFDDALRGPYFYEDGRSIYNYSQVNSDFKIGFETDYLLVWFASMALIFNLVVIILNCVARIFNMLLLYIIAPPFIASAPLDNGGKFRQWTIAFTIQSLSVFGTVIAMQLMLIYLPIVASPQLVLFKDRPLLNAIAQFMLVYGGSEAAKKAGSLVTGILADQAGMEAIRSGDMSGAAGRVISKASGALKAVGGAAAGVAGFALSPVTNTIKRPFKAAGDWWRKLGTGEGKARTDKAIKDEIAKNKAIEKYKESHPEDAKYLGGGSGGSEKPKPSGSEESKPPASEQSKNPGGEQPKNPGGEGRNDPPRKQPPPIPERPKAMEAEDARRHGGPKPGSRVADIRERGKMDEGAGGGRYAREMNNTSNRPSLDRPPAQGQNRGGGANPPEAGPQENDVRNPRPPENAGGQDGDPPKQEGNGAEQPGRADPRERRSFEADDARRPRREPGGRLGEIRDRSGLNRGAGAAATRQGGNRPSPQYRAQYSGAQPSAPRQGAQEGGAQQSGRQPQRASEVQYPQPSGEDRPRENGPVNEAPQNEQRQPAYTPERQGEVQVGPVPRSQRTAQPQEQGSAPGQTYRQASQQATYEYQAPRRSAPQQSGQTQDRPQGKDPVNEAPQNAPQPQTYAQEWQQEVRYGPVPQSRRTSQPQTGQQAPGQTYQQASQQATYQYEAPRRSAPQQSGQAQAQPQGKGPVNEAPPQNAPQPQTYTQERQQDVRYGPVPQSRRTSQPQMGQQVSGQSAYRQASQQATYQYEAPRRSAPQQSGQTQTRPQGKGPVNEAPPQSAPQPQTYTQERQQDVRYGPVPQSRRNAQPQEQGSAPGQTYQQASQQATYQYQAPRQSANQAQQAAYTPQRQATVNIPPPQRQGGSVPQQSYTQPQYTQPRYTQPQSAPQQSANQAQQAAYTPQRQATVNIPPQQRQGGSAPQQSYTQPQYTQPQYTQPRNAPPQAAYQSSPRQAEYSYQAPPRSQRGAEPVDPPPRQSANQPPPRQTTVQSQSQPRIQVQPQRPAAAEPPGIRIPTEQAPRRQSTGDRGSSGPGNLPGSERGNGQ